MGALDQSLRRRPELTKTMRTLPTVRFQKGKFNSLCSTEVIAFLSQEPHRMPDFSAIRPYSNNSLKVDTYFDSYDDEPIA